MYIETYKQLLPEMNEFQLRQQKSLFENNYKAAGNNWHPIDKIIYEMILEAIEKVTVFELE